MFFKRKEGVNEKLKAVDKRAKVCLLAALESSAISATPASNPIDKQLYRRVESAVKQDGQTPGSFARLIREEIYIPESGDVQLLRYIPGDEEVFDEALRIASEKSMPIAVYTHEDHVAGVDHRSHKGDSVTVIDSGLDLKKKHQTTARETMTKRELLVRMENSTPKGSPNLIAFPTVDRFKK